MLKRVSLGGRDVHAGVFRNGVNLGMEGYLVRKSLLSDTETETEAATDRRVTENHYPSDDNPYDSLYPVDDRADSVSVTQHWPKLKFASMASARRHATATPSMRSHESLRVSCGSRGSFVTLSLDTGTGKSARRSSRSWVGVSRRPSLGMLLLRHLC